MECSPTHLSDLGLRHGPEATALETMKQTNFSLFPLPLKSAMILSSMYRAMDCNRNPDSTQMQN